MILEHCTTDQIYVEYFQHIPLSFSFVNKVNDSYFKELNTPMMCREVLCESITRRLLSNFFSIKKSLSILLDEIDLDDPYFCLTSESKYLDRFIINLDILHKVEKLCNIEKLSEIIEIEYNSNVYNFYKLDSPQKLLLKIDKKWFSSPLLVSIYSLVIRMCCYDTKESTIKSLYNSILNLGIDELSTCEFGDYSVLKDIEYDDLIILLSNIDTILGNNPITGLDDQELLKQLGTTVNLSKYSVIRLFSTENTYTSWSLYNSSRSIGLTSLLKEVNYMIKGMTFRSSRYYLGKLGVDSFYNLVKIND